MFEKKEIIDLITELVKIESVNTWLVPAGHGEKEVQLFIQNYLADLGIESHFEEVEGGSQNLVGCLPGNGTGKNITLYAHADTVGYELWKDEALTVRQDGDRIYGLGTADDKGHCAAIMLALKELKESGAELGGDVHFCFVCDEEGATTGSIAYVKAHEPEPTLILESAPPEEINVTHQGFGRMKIITKGKAGHGSAGGVAVDAIYHMAEVIVRLNRDMTEKFALTPDPMNGETVYHTSTIQGGTDFASYPEECVLGIEIGTQVGEKLQNRIDEIEAIFEEVKEICPDFDGRIEVALERDPFIARGHEELYDVVAAAVEKNCKVKPVAVGDNSWGDAQLFQDGGFPTIGLGAEGGNLHAPGEWLSVTSMQNLVAAVTDAIREFCK